MRDAVRNSLVVRGTGGSGKGGGATGRVAHEDPDSLTSRQAAKLIEVISEGEIKGFADPDHPMRCVAIGKTPVENSDGSLNFRHFSFFFLPGTQDQSFLPGFNAAANISAENVKVTTATPWTKRFTDPSLDAVRLDIRFPRLQKQNPENGDISGTSVQLKMYIKEAADTGGATFILAVDDTIRGKASNPYVRGYRLDIGGMTFPVDIRVERITDDHDETQAIQDDTFVESYSEVKFGKLRYPNTALIGASIDAEQFGSNIDERAYLMLGRIIRVPLNYDPVTRLYATTGPGTDNGTWNGEWKLAWTNNPAWCYLDMATHKRYGLGNFLSDANMSKFALYSIAQYSDGWNARPGNPDNNYGPTGKHGVPDGKGGFEPRFMCNLFLQAQGDAMKVLTDMATIFRGMHYFASGVLVPIQDKPRTADIQFGPGNVVNGAFVYSGTARKQRHTAALVSYNDPNNFSLLTPEPFEDGDAILRFGYNPMFITNLGTTSQMCARRAGKWALTAERILTDTVAFTTGAEGFVCKPGMLIQITDPLRAGVDFSGRIFERTLSSITGDREIELTDEGAPYYIYFTYYDESLKRSVVVARLLTNASGKTKTFTFASGNLLPDVDSLWQISSANVKPELFSVLGSTPKDNATVEIIALQYNDSLYAHIDDDAPLVEPGPGPLPNPNFVIPIRPKIYTDGKSTAGSNVFESATDRFNQTWVGHRISAPGITGAIVLSVEDPRHLTMSEESSVTDLTVTYEFSAIGVVIIPLIDPVNGVSRDIHIGWLRSTDMWLRGYRVAFRFNDGNWTMLPESGGQEMIIENAIPGIYEVSVMVVNRFGRTSSATFISINVGINNPLEGAVITGLEIAGQGSDTDFTGRDVQFTWRVNAPRGWVQADDGNADPFFAAYQVTMYNADLAPGDPGYVIQPTIDVTQPTYTFTFPNNARCPGGPFPRFKIGVAIRDRFQNVSDEEFLTANKLPPLKPIEPCNLIPTIRGISAQWTNQPDVSRKQINFYKNLHPAFSNDGKMVTTASADSTQKAIDGLDDVYAAFWVESEDVFGLKSTVAFSEPSALFLGIVIPGHANETAEVTFVPDGGSVLSLGSLAHITHPEAEAQIWYRISSSPITTPITNNTADGSLLYNHGAGIAISGTKYVAAAAYIRGLWGPTVSRVFTDASGIVGPTFSPPGGTHRNSAGELDITISSAGVDAIFYTERTNGTTPPDPTYDGSFNPTGTTIKELGDTVSLTLSRGPWKFKALALTGSTPSSISAAAYSIIRTGGLEP